jgi:hypothetical protein
MDLAYTEHASHVVKVRAIQHEWIVSTLEKPVLREPDPKDPELERFYRQIPEFGDRVLRVVVNTRLAPWRIVSVFFDRRMKGKL